MKFLVDKYTCKASEAVTPSLVVDNNIQHLLVVGSNSSQKEAVVQEVLLQLYGPGCTQLKSTEYTIHNYGSNSTKIRLRQSNYHMILVPNNSALDKYVLQEVVLDFCKKNDILFFNTKTRFKCVVIHKADNLSEQAQFCLRRVMETTTRSCRFILLSTNPCNFISPIRSRFIQVSVPTPTVKEVNDFIDDVSHREGLEDTSPSRDITRDYRTALWKLESRKHGVDFCNWWESVVDSIAKELVREKRAQVMNDVRHRFGQLFVSNIESRQVLTRLMKTLFEEMGSRYDRSTFAEVARLFARYDCRLKNATRYVLHLEALFCNLVWVLAGHPSPEQPALL